MAEDFRTFTERQRARKLRDDQWQICVNLSSKHVIVWCAKLPWTTKFRPRSLDVHDVPPQNALSGSVLAAKILQPSTPRLPSPPASGQTQVLRCLRGKGQERGEYTFPSLEFSAGVPQPSDVIPDWRRWLNLGHNPVHPRRLNQPPGFPKVRLVITNSRLLHIFFF